MKQADIINLSIEDLKAQIADSRANYSKMKLAHKISPVENPIQIRDLRRTIARLNTELTKKLEQQ
jgi:large subunit ribosomal protein L29